MNHINYSIIEINFVNFCNLRCFNCCSSCAQAPEKSYITLDIIQKFIDDSVALSWKWTKIKMYGGEPTLHPQFDKCLSMLLSIKKSFLPKVDLILQTNGCGEKTKRTLKNIPSDITVWNSKKYKNKYLFETYNVAPIDLPQYQQTDFTKGCFRLSECGLGLSCDGKYYACAPGSHVDRIFRLDCGYSSLQELKEGNIREQIANMCRYCGLFKNPKETSVCQVTSKSWLDAYQKYYNNKKQAMPDFIVKQKKIKLL